MTLLGQLLQEAKAMSQIDADIDLIAKEILAPPKPGNPEPSPEFKEAIVRLATAVISTFVHNQQLVRIADALDKQNELTQELIQVHRIIKTVIESK